MSWNRPFALRPRGAGRPTFASLLAAGLLSACGADLTINPGSLPRAIEGTPYLTTLTSDGEAPLTWTLSEGALPAGLLLSKETGALSGTATVSGSFPFTVTNQDDATFADGSGRKAYTLEVIPKLVNETPPPPAKVGISYDFTFSLKGGVPPYTRALAGLPAGLSFNAATGQILGTPRLVRAAYPLELTISDKGEPQQVVTFPVTLQVRAPGVKLQTTTLPEGTSNVFYSQTLQASGGTANLRWEIADGALPAGLSLSLNNGIVSGTPSASGTFSFKVKVSDLDSPPDSDTGTVALVIKQP